MDAAPDRYVSFKGINCDDNAGRLIAAIRRHIDDPAKTNPFWERFKERLAAADAVRARTADGLCLLCAHVCYIDELFEEHDDAAGLALLRKLEDECC